MTTAGVFRRATLATVLTEAGLVCLLATMPTLTATPANVDLPGGTSVPAPSSTPEVTVPSVNVGPVSTPEVSVPSEPVPSTSTSTSGGGGSGDPGSGTPPADSTPRGGGSGSSGSGSASSAGSGSHAARPRRPGADSTSSAIESSGEGSAQRRSTGTRSTAGTRGATGSAASANPFASTGTAAAASPGIAGAGLVSQPLGRHESLDSAAGHTLSRVFDRLRQLDPRVAIREATGWTPSYVDMVLLLMGCGLLVFMTSATVLLGRRDARPAA
jgi:hypothetical protein